MTKHTPFEIQSVFSKWLGRRARKMVGNGDLRIIEVGEFPAGVPLHEDGSTEYDPRKPYVLFAVRMDGEKSINRWNAVLREYDEMCEAS